MKGPVYWTGILNQGMRIGLPDRKKAIRAKSRADP